MLQFSAFDIDDPDVIDRAASEALIEPEELRAWIADPEAWGSESGQSATPVANEPPGVENVVVVMNVEAKPGGPCTPWMPWIPWMRSCAVRPAVSRCLSQEQPPNG